MDDLEKYINKRKSQSIEFENIFDDGYENFKIGVILKKAREAAGITQEELAVKLKTKKSAISYKIMSLNQDILLEKPGSKIKQK